ncbi:MAG: cytidine deaminase [Candidatus Aureabacteria bacterium]|nr:cytidine deaminase [Candidatus Auribacterota bacterium]
MITKEQENRLVKLAREAREKAYAPYSGYKVGAAALAESGKYYTGVNIENAAYTTALHAELAAIAAAVAAGERKFVALAVVTENDPPPFPCAICRQGMAEFDQGEMLVIAANLTGKTRKTTLKKLYPYPFGSRQLGIDPTHY